MADSVKQEHSGIYGRGIFGRVSHGNDLINDAGPVSHAEVRLFRLQTGDRKYETDVERTRTDTRGRYRFDGKYEDAEYIVRVGAFGKQHERPVTVANGAGEADLNLSLGLKISTLAYGEGETLTPATRPTVGKPLVLRAGWPNDTFVESVRWNAPRGVGLVELGPNEVELLFSRSGKTRIEAIAREAGNSIQSGLGTGGDPNAGGSDGRAEATVTSEFVVSDPDIQMIGGNVGVTLRRTASDPTLDQALWVAIRNRTNAISFGRYRDFINRVLRWEENDRFPDSLERRMRDLGTHLHGVGAYNVLKTATEIFLLLECGVRIESRNRRDAAVDLLEEQSRLGEQITPEQIADRLKEYLGQPAQLPYITRVVEAAFPEFERASFRRDRVLAARIHDPCLLELIWSYWHEEGMLMQTINAVSQRFQNIRRPGDRDPLLNLEIDPLRPVNNLLWGYIQDEVHRLSVGRRSYEYLHEYGLSLYGKAVPGMPPADTRSKFLEAFHNLLYQSCVFFKEDFQTTVIADGFPLLNALKEVHLILAQGAHNQFGDLPWTARTEMLLAEYILARPEIRDFLQSRVMVPYKEAWMPQVDIMKTMQGWTDVTVTHFRDLGVFGEQLLLSIRYGDWIDVNDEDSAKNWARYWRPEIQGYVHAYRAATGVDLTNGDAMDSTIPARHLQRRLAMQQRVR